MSDYTPERWAEIKAMILPLRYTRYDRVPKVAQGEGRNGRKRAKRAGLPRKLWRRVS